MVAAPCIGPFVLGLLTWVASMGNPYQGFILPWWDRLFGTYRDQPTEGHEGMTIGLRQFRDPGRLTLPWLLVLRFIGKTGNYPISRRGR